MGQWAARGASPVSIGERHLTGPSNAPPRIRKVDTWQHSPGTLIDDKAVDTARVLAADAVEKVGNGHPGTAMSLAPAAYLLFQKVMRRDPRDHKWLGRDRFVLSAGHSSLTQYIQLFYAGDGLELDDLKALRTWGSKTPGHPEYGHTDGVEITTGPLGQGLASAVGFAYAARYERGLFDPDAAPGTSPFDHNIYVIASDGDLEEGVTSEASSLAGHQQLGNLVVIYDSNQISIEDDTNVAFTEDVAKRYEAYHWHVQTVDWKKTGEYVEDVAELQRGDRGRQGGDRQAVAHHPQDDHRLAAPRRSRTPARSTDRRSAPRSWPPSRRCSASTRRRPSSSTPTSSSTPAGRSTAAPRPTPRGRSASTPGPRPTPSARQLLDRLLTGALPDGVDAALPVFEAGKDVSTRAASGKVLSALGAVIPELWGGSADLAESNLTTIEGAASFIPAEHSTHEWTGNPYGRVLHFGIREHAMGAILNGIVLHGTTRAFGGTFLIFSDYMRPAVRLALAHEGAVDLRLDARLGRARRGRPDPPADRAAHRPARHPGPRRRAPRRCQRGRRGPGRRSSSAVRDRPASRSAARTCRCSSAATAPPRATRSRRHRTSPKGAYVLAEAPGRHDPDVILLRDPVPRCSSPSRPARRCRPRASPPASSRCPARSGSRSRAPSTASRCFPASVRARVSIEAGLALTWRPYLGDAGRSVSIEHFGASADYKTLYREFGITTEAAVAAAKESLAAAA